MQTLKIGAKWCSACTDLDKLQLSKLKDAINYDADADSDIIVRYMITKLPTVIQTDEKGTELFRYTGKEEIINNFK